MTTNALTFFNTESVGPLLALAQANAEHAAIRYAIRIVAFNASETPPEESSVEDIKCEQYLSEALQIEQALILRSYIKACDTPRARAVLSQTAEAVITAVASKTVVSMLATKEVSHV